MTKRLQVVAWIKTEKIDKWVYDVTGLSPDEIDEVMQECYPEHKDGWDWDEGGYEILHHEINHEVEVSEVEDEYENE